MIMVMKMKNDNENINEMMTVIMTKRKWRRYNEMMKTNVMKKSNE